MQMVRTIFSFSLFLLVFTGLTGQAKQLDTFKKIKIGGNIRAELIASATPRVDFTMLEGDADELLIDVFGDELEIRFTHRRFWEYFTQPKAKVKIYYTQLQRIQVSAGSTLIGADKIEAPQMELDISSGARCDLQLRCQEVRVDASSGAEVLLEGKAKKMYFDVSSGASIDAFDLLVSEASGDASSGASVRLNCTDLLNAEASSGGEIRFRGNPCTIQKHTSSGGSVRAL